MRLLRGGTAGAESGMSLLEVTLASGMFLVIGYVFVAAVDMGSETQRLVMGSTEENETIRGASRSLGDELKTTSDDRIVVELLEDGNDEVRFQIPVEVGGNWTWGAPSSVDPKAEGAEDWTLCYTVKEAPVTRGGTAKALVRVILDDAGEIQDEEVVAELDEGGDPAFVVEKQGDMWVVQMRRAPRGTGSSRKSMFHVKTRN